MIRADLVAERTEHADARFVLAREKRGEVLLLADLDELRWLAAVALPALIVAAKAKPDEVPSEEPEKLDGQIPGQMTIDEALAQTTA